ncbi:hypothetical protein M9H77_02672 [Catharanthus roseus]|uniref:Uncharacterized protein n=1 Tax=Catharanthus roseus TaxID=4058 RepID=A0ACC0C966_CATRO|nr:hypothetical protein M9H77_02672 [Catharanthus roseus]
MVQGNKKKRAHPETSTGPATTSTPPVSASIPSKTSASPIMTSTPLTSASISLGTSASPVVTSIPLETLALFPQFPYSSLAPISTPSSSSSTAGTSLRPVPSSLARPPMPQVQSVVDSRILILPTVDSFNKQLARAKLIIEIIKEHFVEAHASFGRILDKIKNMWYTEFGLEWGTTAQYTSLYDVWSSDTFKKNREVVQRNYLQGYGSQELFIERELKANAEGLHIETGLPMPTDE